MDADLQYHLRELEIARDANDPRHALPELPFACQRVLDIGCGAGQTLLAMDLKSAVAFGMDCDTRALGLGRELSGSIHFACGSGEKLPYRDGAFDFVVSRVSLPYMNVPVAMREISRVLAPGGQMWCTFHPLSMLSWKHAASSPRRAAFELYRLLNTAALHAGLPQFRFPFSRRTESYQTVGGLRRCLSKAGFREICIEQNGAFLATARKPALAR